MTDEAKRVVQALLESAAMEEVRGYLERGRRFETMSIDDLNNAWARSYETVVGRDDRTQAMDLDDFGAEIRLRGLETPAHLVDDGAMEAAMQRIRDMPDNGREAAKDAIREFLDELDKPKN